MPDIFYLKKIEQMLDKFYNSGEFEQSMNYLFEKFESRFEIFDLLVKYFEKNRLFEIGLSPDMLCDAIKNTFANFKNFADCAEFDRMTNPKCKKKDDFEGNAKLKSACFEFLKDTGMTHKYLPGFENFPRKKTCEVYTNQTLFQ